MQKPLCVDLFCGLGGWAEGFLAEGYDVIGFDVERHRYPARAFPESHAKAGGGIDFNRGDSFNGTNEKRLRNAPLTGGWDEYPGQLVLQDVLTLHGSQFRNAAVIVASPPCQAYSYRAMPWKRAKALPPPDNSLFDACFRIQREACDAAGWYIPLVVENVKGAQPWVGRAAWHYGSFYLWGDVPALMPPIRRHFKTVGHVNKRDVHSHTRHLTNQRESATVKVGGMNGWDGYGKPGYKPQVFNVTAAQRYRAEQGIKQEGSGAAWFDNGLCKKSSRSDSRKAASAQIAKIPFPLASHIARVYKN